MTLWEVLTTEPFLTRLTLPFVLAWAALLLYLLYRTAQAAARRRRPHMAWWYVLGLVALPFAPLAEAPPVFGLAAALMLIGAWHPLAYVWPRRVRGQLPRPRWQWMPVALLFGLALLLGTPSYWQLGLGLGLVLLAVVALWSAAFWGNSLFGRGEASGATSSPPPPSNLPFSPPPSKQLLEDAGSVRWREAREPDPPELTLRLEADGLWLDNACDTALHLRGWQPMGGGNSFYALDMPLGVGENYGIAWQSGWHGVRVWYSPQGDADDLRILRADWPPSADTGRVLN